MPKSFVLLAFLASTAPIAAQETATGTEYRVDSEASWIRVLAWPDGPLKRFGHHHVISHNAISGNVTVAPDPLDSTFELELAVADLVVDNPDQRALEGEEFEGEVPEKDVEGTRGNMLGDRLLHGEQFPAIQIRSRSIEGQLPDVNIVTTVIVKETENTVTFPASIELSDDSFVASGEIELNHEAFGLEPFTAMGGALSVRNLLVLKYQISGTRMAE
jgi:hypothetical protein